MHLWLVWSEFRQDSAEAQRIIAESGTHPVVARRGRIALVEDEVNDFEYRREPRSELCSARDLKRDVSLG